MTVDTGDDVRSKPSWRQLNQEYVYHVGAVADRLYKDSNSDRNSVAAAARADLARLRQGVGRAAGQDPLVWSIVMEKVLPRIPEQLIGKGDAPSPHEEAAFEALTLYALHQRSRSEPMFEPDTSMGTAVGKLARARDSQSMKARFDVLMMANTSAGLSYQLRSLISLLNTDRIPLDHGALAGDLVALRDPRRRDGVRLRWGRDFARAFNPSKAKTTESD